MTKLVQVAKVAIEGAFGVEVAGERVFVRGGFDAAKLIAKCITVFAVR